MDRMTDAINDGARQTSDRAAGLSRRRFLKGAAASAGAFLLASCGGAPATSVDATAVGAAATTAPAAATAPADTAAPAGAATAPATAAAETAAGVSDSALFVAPTAAARPDGWRGNLPPPPKKYDPPLTITQNFDLNGATKFINDETIEDNIWSRWFKEQMGVTYKPAWTAQGSDANDQQWATALASGDLPEFMINVSQENYARLQRADLLEDITEQWERIASPLLKEKKQYPDGPLWRRFKQPDGSLRINAIPWSGEVATNDTILWMRKDWLDKVGMQAPKTLDELAAAAAAFKQAGLAKVGISVARELVIWMGSVDFVFGAYDTMPGYWLKSDGGKLVYGSIQPATREALLVLRKWYADGLIDPEFVTTDAAKSTEKIAANQSGIFSAPYWAPNWPLPDARTNDPAAVWTFFDNPAGANGRSGRARTPLGTNVQAFRKGIELEKIEAVILHANWNLERFLNAFENQDYWNCPCQGYGMLFENYDFGWEDGKLVLGPSGTTGPWAYEGGGGNPTWLYPDALKDYFDQLAKVQAKDPATLNPMEKYLALDPIQRENADAYNLVFATLDRAIQNEFTGPTTPTMLQANATLEKLEEETFIGIITGQKPIEAFDQFVKDWEAQGGSTITEEVNAGA